MHMKLWSKMRYCTLFSFLLLCTLSYSQSTISGVITDENTGETLIGANVLIQGTTEGATTDLDGSYTLSTSQSPPFNIEISYTGFSTQTIEVTNPNQTVSLGLTEGVLFGEDIIVSASRRREKIQEAPASVSVLTARKLEVSANDNAARAIINEPGVYIQQQGAGRVNIQLRGDGGLFGSASFPILDYRSLSGPGLGTFDNLNSPLNNIDIERIEVVRGPGSALYGPGVTSGVVHFLSKSAIDKPGTTIELIGGQLSTYGGSFRHATKVSDKFGFKVNGVLKRGGEFTYDPDNLIDAGFIARTTGTLSNGIVIPGISPGGFIDATLPSTQVISPEDVDPDGDGNPIRDYWNSFVLNGTLEFRPQDDLSVIISGGTNSGTSPFYNSQGVGLSQAVEYWTQARVQKGGLFAQAFWLTNDGGGDTPTFLYQTGSSTKIDRTQLEAQLQYNFDTPNILNANWTAGFDYRTSIANTGNLVYGREEEDDDFTILGGYVQAKFALGDKLDLVLAGRGDRFNFLDETAFSPRAVFVFKPSPKHTFRAGYNRAIGAPTQLQVNIDFPVTAFDVPGVGPVGLAWLLGNKEEQTFGDSPEIVWNSAIQAAGIPNLPVGTPGLPNAVTYGAATAGFLPVAIPNIIQGLVDAGVPLDVAQNAGNNISGYLANPANAPGGFTGSFEGFNLFNRQPLGLIDAPAAKLRTEDTWEIGYKGLIADKFSVSVDVYNRTIDGATLFTGISPTYQLNNLNIAGDLSSALGADAFANPLLQFVTNEFAFLGPAAEAVAEATVAGIIGGYQNVAAPGVEAALLPTLQGLSDAFVLAWTPTQELPANAGFPLYAAGYRTFEAYDYWGTDIGLTYFINNDLSFFGNYSWTSDNQFNPQIAGATEGSTELTAIAQPTNRYRLGVNYTPACGFNGNLSFQHDDSFQAFLGQYSGPTDIKNLVDASLGYKFNTGLFLGISSQNLFDTEYRTFPGFPQIGRRVLGTLRYTFGSQEDNPCGDSFSTPSKSTNAMTMNPKKMDTDGDGVKDHKDLCPEIPGIKKYKGCPKPKVEMDADAAAARVAAEKAAMEAEARRKAEAEAAAARAKEQARLKAEADAKAKVEAEKKRVEEEARMKAEAEAKAKADEAARVAARRVEIETKTREVFSRALSNLKFNSSRSTFRGESQAIMDEVASIMGQYPEMNVKIQGHTDSQGGEEANAALSAKRAGAVMQYLIDKGVSPTRLSASGFGESMPIADNKTAAGRAENRRVEFIVTYD